MAVEMIEKLKVFVRLESPMGFVSVSVWVQLSRT